MELQLHCPLPELGGLLIAVEAHGFLKNLVFRFLPSPFKP